MSLSTEDRIEQLSLGISAVRIRLSKINPCHTKSGPEGGQFCETGGGGGAAKPAKPVETTPKSKPEPRPKKPAGGEETLRTATVKSESNLGGGASVVKLITLEGGGKAVFKPASGESKTATRKDITPGKTTEREAAAWEVAKIVGMSDMVAPAVIRNVGGERGIVSGWQDGKIAKVVGKDKAFDGEEGRARAALFDYVIGNSDRHAGNWLVRPNGNLALIDHGLSFPDKGTPGKGSAAGNTFILNNLRMDTMVASFSGGGKIPPAIAKSYLDNRVKISAALKASGLPPSAIKLADQRIAVLSTIKTWWDLKVPG